MVCVCSLNLRSAGRALLIAMTIAGAVTAATSADPDFARDVFPLFQRRCIECHGPKMQEADLRLDQQASVLEHYSAVVPGDAENSELYRRTVLPAGHDEIMPAIGKPLGKKQTELIRRWIDAGADWPEGFEVPAHWAYEAPTRPAVPQASNLSWVANPIDAFVLRRLDEEGLAPSPEAERATLIRRVSLDLIGLPPTPDEVASFTADERAEAYDELVDRLLAAPQFGERWARPWLDLARYADSHGFQRDDLRQIWAFRDWVIQALNANMPFDQFTVEQLAGDLLPHATEEQKIATGFHRCTMTNVEAGADPEETRTNQVIDRVNRPPHIRSPSTSRPSTRCDSHPSRYRPRWPDPSADHRSGNVGHAPGSRSQTRQCSGCTPTRRNLRSSTGRSSRN
jgi:hypothetical protein